MPRDGVLRSLADIERLLVEAKERWEADESLRIRMVCYAIGNHR
jgi:hypothetical protein